MKKFMKVLLTVTVFSSFSSAVFADGNAFTPLNFEDPIPTSTPTYVQSKPVTPANPISTAISKIMPQKNEAAVDLNSGQIPVGNDNIQNAILELDNAQVGIREDLLNYKAKYSDVDAQYNLVKNERTMLHKQIKSTERRIRNIDRTKEKLRRTMI